MEIVPRSHKLDTKPEGCDADKGVMPVCIKAGTAVLFDRRMWHRRGINTSAVTRRVLFFGYSYRWLRGLDYNLILRRYTQQMRPHPPSATRRWHRRQRMVATHRSRCPPQKLAARTQRRRISQGIGIAIDQNNRLSHNR